MGDEGETMKEESRSAAGEDRRVLQRRLAQSAGGNIVKAGKAAFRAT